MAKPNQHMGSSLDNLLEKTGELAEVNAAAIKRVIAWEIQLDERAAQEEHDAFILAAPMPEARQVASLCAGKETEA